MCNHSEIAWSFSTPSFEVRLEIEPSPFYIYDGDDEDGETQRALNDGELIAFDSTVKVIHRETGMVIGCDSLCGSVYASGAVSNFWTDHRTSCDAFRNTLENKAQRRVICHYFPSMVNNAIAEARVTLGKLRQANA